MIETQSAAPAVSKLPVAKPRIAVLCDYVEEQWPSMDLVAGMVFDHLSREHAAELEVERICPPLRRRFGALGGAFYNADRLLNRFVDYGNFLKPLTRRFDLFHLIDHSYSQLVPVLPAGRTVVTCHDLDTFRCILEPERQPRPRWFRAMTGVILNGFRTAAHVIAVSTATRDEILRFGLHPPERVTVISNGVHPSCSPLPDPAADRQLAQLLPGDFRASAWLLNVGSSMPRKRLDLLLRVFAAVRTTIPNLRLLRVGQGFTAEQSRLARELGVESAIVPVPFLDRDVLAAAYRFADLLVHTADAEGFGLPLVEAMACGCPVIASDIPVLREVGGTAAGFCAVGNIEEWKESVASALGSRERANQKLFANAARFSWSENASQTARLYERLLAQGNLKESV